MSEYQEDEGNFESEGGHIESFAVGFESLIQQFRGTGNPVISGTESYTVGVLKAEGLQWDVTKGFENFISEGANKLWKMIVAFFKGIWEFFFGRSKKAKAYKEDADDLQRIIVDTKIDFEDLFRKTNNQLNESFKQSQAESERNREKDNIAIKKELDIIKPTAERLDNIFNFKPGSRGAELSKSFNEYIVATTKYLPSANISELRKVANMMHSSVMSSAGVDHTFIGLTQIKYFSRTVSELAGSAEKILKEVELNLNSAKRKAEKEKNHKTEYELQQYLRLTNLVMKRFGQTLTVSGNCVKTIKTHLLNIVNIQEKYRK